MSATTAPDPFALAADILAPPPWEPTDRPGLETHQIPPAGHWSGWLLEGGRGCGKTEACSRYFAKYMRENPGHRGRIIAPTFGDAVEACIEGPSGLRAIDPDLKWLPSAPGGAKIVWPNGSQALVLGTPFPKDVDRLRAGGNRHIDWWEEMAANVQLGKAFDQAAFGLRLGHHPHWIASTTPRTTDDYKKVRADDGIAMTHATLFDNPHNPAEWVEGMRRRYEGTRLGRQELQGVLIEEVEGALWTRKILEAARVDQHPELVRIVVAIDPAATSGPDADDTGIIVAGKGVDGDCYLLADRTCHLSPDGWGQRAVRAYQHHDADRIIGEVNNGGEMVEAVVRNASPDQPVAYKSVRASRGKQTRAEPVAALFGDPPKRPPRIHLVGGFPQLEDQMTSWVPGESDSPDRVDAMVWAVTELMLEAQGSWRPL